MNAEDDETVKSSDQEKDQSLCSCVADPFASLPSELHPHNRSFTDQLHKVICQGCGLIFKTNRKTDFCLECEKKEPGLDPEVSP
jgi:hypothetical protein